MTKEMEKLIEVIKALQEKKPDVRYFERSAVERLKNQDCLSIETKVFRNGGKSKSGDAVAFSELTPELLAFFKYLYK